MEDLVTWLRAQLDADAALADGLGYWADYVESTELDDYAAEAAYLRRVLREVEATRRIVDWCVEVIGDRDLSQYGEFGALRNDKQALAVTLAVETLRLLTVPFADRPGYQEEWSRER